MLKKVCNMMLSALTAGYVLTILGLPSACFFLPLSIKDSIWRSLLPVAGMAGFFGLIVLWKKYRASYTRARLIGGASDGIDDRIEVPESDIRRFRIRRSVAFLFLVFGVTPCAWGVVVGAGAIAWWSVPVILALYGRVAEYYLTTQRRWISDRVFWVCAGCGQGYQTPFPLLWDLREGACVFGLCPTCERLTMLEITPAREGPPAWERKEEA